MSDAAKSAAVTHRTKRIVTGFYYYTKNLNTNSFLKECKNQFSRKLGQISKKPSCNYQFYKNLNKRLGIQIYDYSNPYEPVAKDGVIVERMFGITAPCNWLKREKGSDGKRFGTDYLSYVPESERKPAYVPEKYDPADDTIVKDFGEYKGKRLVVKENKYEMYLMHGDDKHPVPNPDPGPIATEVLHDMEINDAILCIEDNDSFYKMIEKGIYDASFPLLNDYGPHNGN